MTRDDQVRAALAHVELPPGVDVRTWRPEDFAAVQALAAAEGWTTLRDHSEDGLRAWEASWPALVAVSAGELVGFARALTDGSVTMYLADLLVAPAWRGRGVGAALLAVCHQLYPDVRIDLLSTGAAQGFYEAANFRPFPGFRKSYW